jgi:hypothetical protein
MLLIECPHCHVRVLPMQNNICPACKKVLSDSPSLDLNKVAIVVRESQELPPYCYACNAHTDRYVRIEGEEEPLWSKILLGIGAFLFLRPSWLRRSDQIDEQTVNVFIFLPQCEQCAEFGKPKPIRVDFEDQQMTFLGSSGFRDRVYPKPDIKTPLNDEIQAEDANGESKPAAQS